MHPQGSLTLGTALINEFKALVKVADDVLTLDIMEG